MSVIVKEINRKALNSQENACCLFETYIGETQSMIYSLFNTSRDVCTHIRSLDNILASSAHDPIAEIVNRGNNM